jgi:hypothetical protein
MRLIEEALQRLEKLLKAAFLRTNSAGSEGEVNVVVCGRLCHSSQHPAVSNGIDKNDRDGDQQKDLNESSHGVRG